MLPSAWWLFPTDAGTLQQLVRAACFGQHGDVGQMLQLKAHIQPMLGGHSC